MSLKEDVARLKELAKETDYEFSHAEADHIIIKYLPKEIADAYNTVGKWYA